jgi:hypothetical protein
MNRRRKVYAIEEAERQAAYARLLAAAIRTGEWRDDRPASYLKSDAILDALARTDLRLEVDLGSFVVEEGPSR